MDAEQLHRRLEELIRAWLRSQQDGQADEPARLERQIQALGLELGFDADEIEDIERTIAWEERGSRYRGWSCSQRARIGLLLLLLTASWGLPIYLIVTERIVLPSSVFLVSLVVWLLLSFGLFLRFLGGMEGRGRRKRAVNRADDVAGVLHLRGSRLMALVLAFVFGLMWLGPVANLWWSQGAILSLGAAWSALGAEPGMRFLVILGLLGSGYCLSLWFTRVKRLIVDARERMWLVYADGWRPRELHLQDFRYARALVSDGEEPSFPTLIVVSNVPGELLRRLLNILPVLRRHHVVLCINGATTASGGHVNPWALSEFFRRRCREAGFRVTRPRSWWAAEGGWVAHNTSK